MDTSSVLSASKERCRGVSTLVQVEGKSNWADGMSDVVTSAARECVLSASLSGGRMVARFLALKSATKKVSGICDEKKTAPGRSAAKSGLSGAVNLDKSTHDPGQMRGNEGRQDQ